MLNCTSITYLRTGIPDLPKVDLRWSSIYGYWFVDWAGNIPWYNSWYNTWYNTPWYNWFAQWVTQWTVNWTNNYIPTHYTISAYLAQGPDFHPGVYEFGALKLLHATNGGQLTVTGKLSLTRHGVD
ncbi:MAG: hypothetical protein V1897_03675 [Pseudomonadota bacterium]